MLLLGLLLQLPGIARAADLHCGPPADWMRLDGVTRVAIRNDKTSDNETGREVSHLLRAVNWHHLHAWRLHVNDPIVNHHVDEVIEGWRNFASTGLLTTPGILLRDLNEIRARTRKICFDPVPARPGSDAGEGASVPSPAGFGMSAEGETLQDYARLTILPAIVVAMAVMAQIGIWIMQWIRTRRYSRRSCDVPGQLVIGEHEIPGKLTVLGLYGCRFVCRGEEEQNLLVSKAESDDTLLRVGNLNLPCSVVSLTEDFSAIRFHLQLSEHMYWMILELSTIKPKFVRLPSIKHNVPQRDITAGKSTSEPKPTASKAKTGSRAA